MDVGTFPLTLESTNKTLTSGFPVEKLNIALLSHSLSEHQLKINQTFNLTRSTKNNCLNINVPIRRLNYDPGIQLNIFIDFHFTCSGRIQYWEFYSVRTNTVYIGVWHRLQNGDIQLLGKNKVEVTDVGHVVCNSMLNVCSLKTLLH